MTGVVLQQNTFQQMLFQELKEIKLNLSAHNQIVDDIHNEFNYKINQFSVMMRSETERLEQ